MQIKVHCINPQNIATEGWKKNQLIPMDFERQYMPGAVAAEMGNCKEIEALKAQAVAARSFAYQYVLKVDKETGESAAIYDTGAAAQAYLAARAKSSSYAQHRQAAEDTDGMILTYNGKPCNTHYSASNGGYVQKSSNKWEPGGYADPYDDSAKKSGHGSGMSQNGAENMAKAGKTYRDILAFYYPGTAIMTKYGKGETVSTVVKTEEMTSKNTETDVTVVDSDKMTEDITVKEYTIAEDLFTLSGAYKSAKTCAKTGIQVHSVGCKGTLKNRWKKSWNAPNRDVCAGYVIDTDAIWRILPDGKRCWLSGKGKNGNANNTHLGFEICEPLTRLDTPETAEDLYRKTVYLCVYLCRKYGINPKMIQDHAELHKLGLASNHGDVKHWWGVKGKSWEPYTMNTLRRDVAAALGTELAEETPETEYVMIRPTVCRGSKGAYVTEAQKRLIAQGYGEMLGTWGADGDFGPATEKAVKQFQRDNKLKVDGIIGVVTWDALLNT